jgi:hypothetical protein
MKNCTEPVSAPHGRDSDARPDDSVAGTDEALLEVILRDVVCGEPRGQLQAEWQIVGKCELLERPVDDAGAVASENLAQAVVEVQEPPMKIELGQTDRRAIDRRAKAVKGIVAAGLLGEEVGSYARDTFLHRPPCPH